MQWKFFEEFFDTEMSDVKEDLLAGQFKAIARFALRTCRRLVKFSQRDMTKIPPLNYKISYARNRIRPAVDTRQFRW